jgi:hypothetical protein
MESLTIDRRAPTVDTDTSDAADARTVVQKGISIQTRLGTIGAVEYLKGQGIGGSVIHRVLASEQIRSEDREMIDGSVRQA